MKMTIQDTNLDDDFTLAEESQDSGPGSTSLGDEKETIQHGTVNTDPLYYDNIEIGKDSSKISLKGLDEKFFTQCALVCISLYSRVVKTQPDMQKKIDEKLKSGKLEDKQRSMLLEKYIIDSLTKCVQHFSSWQEKDLKEILDFIYTEKMTPEQMQKYIQYDDSILDNQEDFEFSQDQMLVHKTLQDLQDKMKSSQKEAQAKGQTEAAKDPNAPTPQDLEQAWAFLGMAVILVTTLVSMVCICCCMGSKNEAEIAQKLDRALKKLEAKRHKITELAESHESLQEELKGLQKDAKHEIVSESKKKTE